MDYSKKRRFSITTLEVAGMRGSWLPSAVRRNALKRPKHFSSIQHHRLGDVMMDFAFLWPEAKNWNKGFIGVVLAVNDVGFTACVGLKGRTTEDFEQCVETLVNDSGFSCLEKLISDRETAVHSLKFQQRIKEKYNVVIHYLEKGNKAYKESERVFLNAR